MTESNKNIDLSVQVTTPGSAGKKKLQQFHDLVLWGEQVNPNFLMKRINNCELLAFGQLQSQLAGIAALKNPAAHHKAEVFESAGVFQQAGHYSYELGYCVTAQEHQHNGVCRKLVKALLDAYAGSWFYSTTKNDHMRKLLLESGFSKLGNSYKNDTGEVLDLYIFNT
ncbi:MAG: family N-acetyltransferase [Mucilaginibacter sp.]|nr:family N-acetyltransferase [Mucilaginibacter sp.]